MRTLFVLVAALVGCAQPEVEPPEVPAGTLAKPDGDMQGRHLLGDPIDLQVSGGYYFWVSKDATMITHGGQTVAVTVSVAAGHLVATDGANTVYDDPRDYPGMVFATGTHPLRIRAVQVLASGDTRYVLEYWDGTDYTDYCDAAIDSHAIAMQGRWTTDRVHVDGSELSFGCVMSGVTAKCIDWDYKPTSTSSGTGWKYHQACTQMANANYCKTGPHTRELTPIDMRDFWTDGSKDSPVVAPALVALDPTTTWPPPVGSYYYEAAWKPNGTVICMTRFRWASLSAGGYCPADVPDPREAHSGGAFCEDLTYAALAADRGALLFDATPMMDMLLYTWQNAEGDNVTTVSGYVEGTTTIIPPFPSAASTYRSPVPDAILLRTLTGTIDPVNDVVSVYQQFNPATGDRVVAPIDRYGIGVTPAHRIGDFEGYLLVNGGPDTVAWNLYRNGDDYVAAMARPSGFAFERFLGYAIAP